MKILSSMAIDRPVVVCKSLAFKYRKVCGGTVGAYGSTLDAAQWLSRIVDATIFTYYTGGSYLNRPSKGLSRMMGNYQVRFLWGNGPQGPDLPGVKIERHRRT